MRLAIVGSREFKDYAYMVTCFERFYLQVRVRPEVIVSGGARGADTLAMTLADDYGFDKAEHPCPKIWWVWYGNRAGSMRNSLIVADCTHVIAFPSKVGTLMHRPGGTWNCVAQARVAEKVVRVFHPSCHCSMCRSDGTAPRCLVN